MESSLPECVARDHNFQVLNASTHSIYCSKCGKVINSRYSDAGVILLWSGSTQDIPKGFALCNGDHGTPDLRDKFVVGSGKTFEVGSTGGRSQVTLVANNVPAHYHNRNSNGTEELAIVDHQLTGGEGTSYAVRFEYKDGYVGQETVHACPHYHVHTGNGGSSNPHPVDIRPPFFALAFIMRVVVE